MAGELLISAVVRRRPARLVDAAILPMAVAALQIAPHVVLTIHVMHHSNVNFVRRAVLTVSAVMPGILIVDTSAVHVVSNVC